MPVNHVNRQAFLQLIAWSEGTDNGRQRTNNRGYDVLVGGGLFTNYADHPRQKILLSKLGIVSTAAGRYQLLARYWDHYRTLLQLPDFAPDSQDAVTLQQLQECRALVAIDAGQPAVAVARCKHLWASLPGAGYGQHEHTWSSLLTVYLAAGGVATA